MDRLFVRVDARSSVAFRMLFGLTMAYGVARFWAKGWIDELYVQPSFFFHYWGLSWVRPASSEVLHGVFALMFCSALLLGAGRLYRPAAAVFFGCFTYVELLDVTNYLNHYYLVSALALLLLFMPLDHGVRTVPAWVPWALRLQLSLVYVYAGLAKLDADWLIAAQPLKIWLEARGGLPIVGWLLRADLTAHAMAIAGAAFDLSVGFLLWNRRARPWAYAAVVCFHVATGLLFNIGIFPVVMIALTTVFFDEDWPRRVLRPGVHDPASRTRHLVVGALAVWFCVQLLLPLRVLLYPPDPLWHEQGFRFSWRVMLMEKTGSVEFIVEDPQTGRRWRVDPASELTRQQARMMAASPELILQYAHHIDAMHPHDLVVRADAWAALNGRRSARLIDPKVDLTTRRDGLNAYDWVLPAPP